MLFPCFFHYTLPMHLLIVEDEQKIANFLRRGFLEENYAIDIAKDGEEALYQCDINNYDCVVLDIMLPKINGIDVCRKIREKNTSLPILMLTARDAVEEKIVGLDAGADDYVTKPFSFGELSARVRALIRRGNKKADPTILMYDTLVLDPAKRTAVRNGKTIILTSREYALLEYFMRNPEAVLTKTQILEHVWDYNYQGMSNIVETYIKYLRKKIKTKETDLELIHTMRGSGYILKMP